MSDNDNERAIELIEIDRIISTKGGRSVMKRILDATGVHVPGFDKDPYINAGNSCRRETGLWLIEELKAASTDKYLTLMKESIDE